MEALLLGMTLSVMTMPMTVTISEVLSSMFRTGWNELDRQLKKVVV